MPQETRFSAASVTRRATTLVEVIVSCMIVAVMLVAAMKSVGAVYKTRLVAVEQGSARFLAHALMAEVLRANYEDPVADSILFGRESGELTTDRTKYNDIDDYDGWSASPPEEKDGTPIPNFNGWSRAVDVRYAQPNAPTNNWVLETGLKRIEVTVTSPSGDAFEIVALRADAGALEAKSPVDRTYVEGASAQLRLGTGRAAIGETPVFNHAAD